eukprot:2607517-Rhodomonas_salina.1
MTRSFRHKLPRSHIAVTRAIIVIVITIMLMNMVRMSTRTRQTPPPCDTPSELPRPDKLGFVGYFWEITIGLQEATR